MTHVKEIVEAGYGRPLTAEELHDFMWGRTPYPCWRPEHTPQWLFKRAHGEARAKHNGVRLCETCANHVAPYQRMCDPCKVRLPQAIMEGKPL